MVTRNPDGSITPDQRPSGGRPSGSGTPITKSPLAKDTPSKGPRITKQPGRGPVGKSK